MIEKKAAKMKTTNQIKLNITFILFLLSTLPHPSQPATLISSSQPLQPLLPSFPWPCHRHSDCISRVGWYGECQTESGGRCRALPPTIENRICTGFFHCHLLENVNGGGGQRGECNRATQRCRFPPMSATKAEHQSRKQHLNSVM